MARLPVPGSDDGEWGDILNGFLLVSHNADGTFKVPFDLGSGLVDVSATGRMTLTPTAGETALVLQSTEDDVDTLNVQDQLGHVVAALKPTGLYARPTQPSSVGLFVDVSELDGSSLLMDLENGGSVFTVDVNGATQITLRGDDAPSLTLRPNNSQTTNLQEWQDRSGNAVAWIGSDGTPGGALASGGGRAGTGLPVGDPGMFTLDTSTYANAFDDGAYATAVFSNVAPAFVIAQDGDQHPRWLMTSDATTGLYLSDGTVDPYTHGSALWTGGVPDGFEAANINLWGSGIQLTVGQVDPADATNPTITAWGDLQLTDLQQTVGVVFRARLGDPNGAVAGRQGDVVIDGLTPAVWQCTQTGDATGAIWGEVASGGGSVPGWVGFLADEPLTGDRLMAIESEDNSAVMVAGALLGGPEDPSGGVVSVATNTVDGIVGKVQLDSFPDFSNDLYGDPRVANLQILRNSGTPGGLASIFVGDFANEVSDFILFDGGSVSMEPSSTDIVEYGLGIFLQADMVGVVVQAAAGQNSDLLQLWNSNGQQSFTVDGGGGVNFAPNGTETFNVANGAVGFFAAGPAGQQTATDGDSLVVALQSYGLLDSDASWDSHAVTTDHDFFITGDGTLPITETQPGVGFGVESGNHNPHVEVVAPSGGSGTAYIDLTIVGTDFKARLAWDDHAGAFTITGPGIASLSIGSTGTTINGRLVLPDLPTSDPGVAGALWNSAGTVEVSAGS